MPGGVNDLLIAIEDSDYFSFSDNLVKAKIFFQNPNYVKLTREIKTSYITLIG